MGANYIIHEKQFVETNQNIYKIGKTTQHAIKRYLQHPKGSVLKIQMSVANCTIVKNKLKKTFDEKFINRKDIGREYYEGNYDEMEIEFINVINTYRNENDN